LNTAGAVLTGGRSRRMGTDKALLEVDGVRMAERVAAALAAGGCQPVVFVGGDERRLRAGGRDWYPDRWPGEGPVGGVLTALDALGGDVLVAACDLVDLDGGTVAALLAAATVTDADVVAARSDRMEPMLARWRQSSRSTIEERFGAGERALHRVLAHLAVVQVAVDPARLRNVNTAADLGRPSASPR
jgi:molybdopterin-guanine dinucleotide biosynthesis protein A